MKIPSFISANFARLSSRFSFFLALPLILGSALFTTHNAVATGASVDQSGPIPTTVVSRKTHGSAGPFDIDLPLTGAPGIESRFGGPNGDYTMVVTFSNNVTSPTAIVTSGIGSVVSVTDGCPSSCNVVTIQLTAVTSAQTINVTLTGGNFTPVVIPMCVLVGDVAGDPAFVDGDDHPNGLVNSTDVADVVSHVGQVVDSSNFRADVNANGVINATDVAICKSFSGTGCDPNQTVTRASDQHLSLACSGCPAPGPNFGIYIAPTGSTNFTVEAYVTFSSTPPYNAYGFSYWLETNYEGLNGTYWSPHLSLVGVTYMAPFQSAIQITPNPAFFDVGYGHGATFNDMAEARDLGAIANPLTAIPPGTYHVADLTFSITGCGGTPLPDDCAASNFLKRTVYWSRFSEVTSTDFHDNYMDFCPPCAPLGEAEGEFMFTLHPAATAINAVSRKTHGGAGDFDVDLPLTGTPGIECRTGGAFNDFTIIVSFSDEVVGTPTAQVTSGTGCVGSGGNCDPNGQITATGNAVMIPLTNVSDQQTINVTVTGGNLAPTVIPISRLLADANASGTVNAADVSLNKNRTGPVDETNFRSDVTANGVINAADIALVKANTGHSLP